MSKYTTSEMQRLIECEKRERYALKHIVDHLRAKHPQYEYVTYMTPVASKTPYDALLWVKENGKTISLYIVEMKNRTEVWDEFYYEKAKHNNLNKSKKNVKIELGIEPEILYISVTEKGTYVFPIDEMILPKMKREAMASESFVNQVVQRNKAVYRLKKLDAIYVPYSYSEAEYLRSLEPVKVKTFEQPKPERFVHTLF